MTRRILVCTIVAAALARLLILGLYPLTDMTEARYSEIARMMAELDDWVTPWFDEGVPFWGKPPLSIWLTAASFKLFGISEFAARLPHWLAGVAAAWLTWGLSAQRSRREALYALAVLAGSLLFFVSAGAVMTDMVLAIGVVLAMRGFWLGLHGAERVRRRERWLLFVGLAVGLLAKGPVVIVLAALPIAAWTLWSRNLATVWREIPWIRGSLLMFALAAPWYVMAELRTPGFLEYFLVGEHWNRFLVPGWEGDLYGRAHEFRRGTIWVFQFLSVLPWVLLFPVAALYRRARGGRREPVPADRGWLAYLLLWGLAPAAFFTGSGNILYAYALPGIPALACLAGTWLARRPDRKPVERLLTAGIAFTVILIALYVASLPITGRDEARSTKGLVADYEARRDPGQPLVLFGERRFSADFYSRGGVEYAVDAAGVEPYLRRGSAFLAIPDRELRKLPDSVTARLQPLQRHGPYLLFFAEPGDDPRTDR